MVGRALVKAVMIGALDGGGDLSFEIAGFCSSERRDAA